MTMDKVRDLAPARYAAYWIAAASASVFSANLGDYLAWDAKLGQVYASVVFAALFFVLLIMTKVVRSMVWPLSWTLFCAIRALATDMADAMGQFHIGFQISIPATAFALLLLVLVWARLRSDRDEGGVPGDAACWLVILAAGMLGTSCGDALAYTTGLFAVKAALIFSALLLVVLISARYSRAKSVFFAVIMVLVSSFGTTVADVIGQAIGEICILLTGGFLLVWVTGLYMFGGRNNAQTLAPGPSSLRAAAMTGPA